MHGFNSYIRLVFKDFGELTSRKGYKLKTPNTLELYLFISVVTLSILVSRRPDAVFNPQFWAEDGSFFYAIAHDLGGLSSLLIPHAGYLNIVPRLVAALSQLFPLAWAPAIFNSVALSIQTLPVFLLASKRLSELIPNLSTRLFLALLYLSIPNCHEIHGNITNSQWYLALLSFMVVIAPPSKFFIWRLFDISIVFLSAFTGPFSILLLPIALIFNYINNQKIISFIILELTVGAMLQAEVILLTSTRYLPAHMALTFEELVEIFNNKIFVGAFIGTNGYAFIPVTHPGYMPCAALFACISLIIMTYALLKSSLELKLFIVYSMSIFCLSLVSVGSNLNQLVPPGNGERYGFMPMLAFIVAIVWMLQRQHPGWVRKGAALSLVMMLIGIVLNWEHPKFIDMNFNYYVNVFEHLKSGSSMIFPINPGWSMGLTKH